MRCIAWPFSIALGAQVQAVNTAAAMRVPGAVRFVGPVDIPGANQVRVPLLYFVLVICVVWGGDIKMWICVL